MTDPSNHETSKNASSPAQQPEDAFDAPSKIPWPPLLIAITVISAVGLHIWFPLPWPGLDDLAARVVGLSFGFLGLILIAWSAITLRRHNTTIMPHQGAQRLVTDGPFAWRRNPIYLGDVFLFLGLAELTKIVWFAILAPVFMLLVTWLAILPEERHLLAKFGSAYEAYKAKTRRWL